MSALRLRAPSDPYVNEVYGNFSDMKLFHVLRRYLESDEGLTAVQATVLIYDMLPSRQENDGDGIEYSLSYQLLEVAQQIPCTHPSQIKLVRLIELLLKCDKLNERVSPEGYWFYYGMENFWIAIREMSTPDFDIGTEEESKHINLSAFLARLMSAGILRHSPTAIWAMRDNLEEEYSTKPNTYSSAMTIAAVWILCAGPVLFDQIVQPVTPPDEHNERSWHNGPRYTGPIVGVDRWRFWQKAFAAGVESSHVNDQSRQLALKAIDYMGAIERNCTW